jgi:phosphoserine phosphatase
MLGREIDMKENNVLIIEVNHKDTARIPIDEEIREIENKIKDTKYHNLVRLIEKHATRTTDLPRILSENRPIIVYFSGHGDMSGIIIIDNEGNPKTVNPEAIKDLLDNFKDCIKLVFLNACYSESSAKAITEVIDYAIGMNKEIGSKDAAIFASQFFGQLFSGCSVQKAFDLAKITLRLEDSHDTNTPVLFVRAGVNASEPFPIPPNEDIDPGRQTTPTGVVVPNGGTMPKSGAKYQVVAFDLDGTLLRGDDFNYSWRLVWDYLNLPPELHKTWMSKYLKGDWTYEMWCKKVCGMFITKGLTHDTFREILKPIELTKNFEIATKQLKDEKMTLGIISGSIDTFLEMKIPNYKEIFGHNIYINHFKFDEYGRLCGVVHTDYDFDGKAKALEEICQKVGCTIKEAIWVGEGFNDNTIVTKAGLSIAYPPHDTKGQICSKYAILCDDMQKVVEAILQEL